MGLETRLLGMARVTLADVEAFLVERQENQHVTYDMAEVEDVSAVHEDHLFEALTSLDPEEELVSVFEAHDEVFSATEVVVEHVQETFDADVLEMVPRPVLDSYIRCSAQVLEDQLDGVEPVL